MIKLILDKSKWICGDPNNNSDKESCLGEGNTELLNDKGYMCCLGQFCKQLITYITDEELLGKIAPSNFNYAIIGLNEPDSPYNWRKDSQLSNEAIIINDNIYTTIEEKIEKLKELFLKHNFEIEVIN